MKCSQCDKSAITNLQGHPLCVEHAAMMAQVQNIQNDNIRLLMAQIEDDENSINAMFGLPPKRPMQIPAHQVIHAPQTTVNDYSIKIDRSTVGVLNTGIVSTINASVSLIQATNQEHAEQIKNLIEAVSNSKKLSQEEKKDSIEQISYLLSQIPVLTTQRNTSVIRTIFTSIEKTLATSVDVYTLWKILQPIIATYLNS